MFPELSLSVNIQESKYPFSVNAYESEYSKITESEKIFSSVNQVLSVANSSNAFPGKYFVHCLRKETIKHRRSTVRKIDFVPFLPIEWP